MDKICYNFTVEFLAKFTHIKTGALLAYSQGYVWISGPAGDIVYVARQGICCPKRP